MSAILIFDFQKENSYIFQKKITFTTQKMEVWSENPSTCHYSFSKLRPKSSYLLIG